MAPALLAPAPAAVDVATPPPRAAARRIDFLDSLRGLAIAVVIAYHFSRHAVTWHRLGFDGGRRVFQPDAAGPTPLDWLAYPLTLGWSGVALFFVLSGYVIHWNYRADAAFSPPRFLARRFWRIVPPYLAALFGLALLQPAATPPTLLDLTTHVALVHNFFPSAIFSVNGSFWSLALECQFYLLYPVVMALRGRYGLTATLGFVALLSVAIRLALLQHFSAEYTVSVLWASPPILWVDWVLGAWLAERHAAGRRAFPNWRALPWAAFALFVGSTLFEPTNAFAFTLASLAFAAVIDRLRFAPPAKPAGWRPLAKLGLVSYSVYLWHEPVPGLLERLAAWCGGTLTPVTAVLLALPLSLLWGWLMYATIETGSIALGRRLAGRAVKPAEVAKLGA